MSLLSEKKNNMSQVQEWRSKLMQVMALPDAVRDRVPYQDLNPSINYSALTTAKPEEMKRAAVLIPVIDRHNEPTVLFTVRSSDMPSHAGQISFPGGRVHPEDQNRIATALRETEEEVGIPRDTVEIVGELGTHYGGMGYAVTPVVGIIPGGTEFFACDREVHEIFEVPLAFLLDRENYIVEEHTYQSATYKMYAAPFDRWHIWGLTAGIVRSFMELMEKV